MSSDSESNHSFLSEHSDGGDLPFFPTFSSPTKNTEQRASTPTASSPGGITATLSAATISTPEKRVVPPAVNWDHLSPHQSHSDRKALEQSRKLARKAEELARRVVTKRDRDEKVENYIRCGGVRALSDEWEETKRREASLSDCGDNDGTVPRTLTADGDLQSFLPKKPPGQTFFIKPPDFIMELYPPGYEEDPTNNTSMFANVEDNLLTQQDPTILKMVICGEWLKLCYLHKPCPPLVWQWLFQIMCRSHDSELSNGAFQSLTSLIQVTNQRQDASSILIPSLSDLTDILVHLGAASLSAVAGSLSEPMEEDCVFDVASPMQNLSHMLQYLTMCLKSKSGQDCYNVQEIETLIVLFVRMSLDHHICGEPIQYHVSLCIAALVSVVSDDQWAALLVRLVVRITAISEHHHDKLFMTYLMSGTSQRLHQLQRELCQKSLEQLTEVEESKTDDCALIRHVVEYFLSRQRSHSFEEYYTMFSVFSLVYLSMHPSVIVWPSPQERKELSLLLGNLSSTRVRDDPDHPERSAVKDLIIRIMLEVKTQKDKTTKQENLFAYMS